MYVLNLADDKRILSASKMLSNGSYNGHVIVNALPDTSDGKWVCDYIYKSGKYVYDPLSRQEEISKPSQLDVIEAQVTYTAMMTDTLLGV